MVGLELPILAMEHQYLITEDMPEIAASSKEQLHVIDFEGEIYMRQERGGMLMGTYERRGQPWSEQRDALGFRPGSPAQRSRPHRAFARGRLRAFPGDRARRHQAGRQRPLHLRARRQPVDRPHPGLAQFLGRLRRDGRLQPGRRRRALARELDDARRSGRRHLGHGRRPLRRFRDARLHQRQGARELLAPLPHPLPERGARGREALAHDADLRNARRRKTPSSARIGGSSTRSGSRRRAPNRRRRSPSSARTRIRMSARR